jgi:hypothetical protein
MKCISLCCVATLALMACAFFTSCNTGEKNDSGYINKLSFAPGEESKIAEALLSLKDSSVVELKAGIINSTISVLRS